MAVTHYSTHYLAKSDKPWIADINCYDQPQGEAGGHRIAAVRFFVTTPVPASGAVGGIPVINFPLARFADVISIFRDEKSIDVNHFSGGPDNMTSDGISYFTSLGGMRP
jgi:hypothetical protein